ncbi:MAG: hypothetical protein H6954_09675 [Chromatiaceae bacterium]|nr:hypothetical protein [Chromatiaceae bacterium]
MNHFDRIDRDPSVRRIHSTIFEYAHSAGPARDQSYINDQVKKLRSAYLAASIHAAKGYLQRVVRSALWRLPKRNDCSHCG